MYSFDMNERSIILVPLTPKQVYDELLKLKGRWLKKRACISKRPYLLTKFLWILKMIVIIQFGFLKLFKYFSFFIQKELEI